MAYSEKTWLTEAIFDKLPPHTGVRILKYSYITDERNGSAIYTKQSIRAHAVQLIKGLSKLREYEVCTSIRLLSEIKKTLTPEIPWFRNYHDLLFSLLRTLVESSSKMLVRISQIFLPMFTGNEISNLIHFRPYFLQALIPPESTILSVQQRQW